MTNQDTLTEHQLNDQLAKFADHVLDQSIAVDLSKPSQMDQTLLDLQQTVLRLAHAFESETSEEAEVQVVAQRIKSNCKKEWHKIEPGKKQKSTAQNWVERISIKEWFLKQPRNRRPAYAFAFASAVLVFLFLSLSILFPDFVGGQDLTGTATGGNFPIQALVVFVIASGLVYLFVRRKR